MKKSSFVALVLGTVSMGFFALGICMALVAEWNAMRPGIVSGLVGMVLGIITLLIWRKMEHKAPIKFDPKIISRILIACIGTLIFGVGMCLCIVWNKIIPGSVIGIAGLIILLILIPLIKGIK